MPSDWLHDEALQGVLRALDADSGHARIVGGAVRNSLLNIPVSDVDIATVWQPAQVIERIEAAGLKAVPTGLAHGTITAVSGERPFEVTTLRVDLKGFGRHAEIAFTEDWVADAGRRDFTINALYLNSDGTVFDPLGGRQDLAARRVRFIGNADDRIHEDYLRILRFFRFHAQFADGPIDGDGLAACIRGREGVRRLSAERVRSETLRLLGVEQSADTVEILAETGILTDLLGGVAYLQALRRYVKIERDVLHRTDALARLAVLGCKIPEDAARLAARLKLSKAEGRRMSLATDGYWRLTPDHDEKRRRSWLYRFGADVYRDRVLLAWIRAYPEADVEDWRELLELPANWTAPRFPVTAKMVTEKGIEPGEKMGRVLRAAENCWILAGFPESKPELAKILDDAIAEI